MPRNPIGPDGLPMEKHHPARQSGDTDLIPKTEHDLIHEGEREAVRDVFERDGLTSNPGSWTSKRIKKDLP